MKGTIVGDYLNSVRYADEALEGFFDELKEEGLYENSIICIYGDHYGLSCTDPEIKKIMTDLIGEDYNYKWHFNIPLIINIRAAVSARLSARRAAAGLPAYRRISSGNGNAGHDLSGTESDYR